DSADLAVDEAAPREARQRRKQHLAGLPVRAEHRLGRLGKRDLHTIPPEVDEPEDTAAGPVATVRSASERRPGPAPPRAPAGSSGPPVRPTIRADQGESSASLTDA